MRRVVVDMQNALFADAIASILQDFDVDFEVYPSENPAKTVELCTDVQANVLIMEVTAYAPRQFVARMALRNELHRSLPTCKLVLLVDENMEGRAADQVRRAKKDGLIDGFLYSSVSASYFSALIDTL